MTDWKRQSGSQKDNQPVTSKCRAIALANVIAKRRARAQARRELAHLTVEIEARFEALDDEVRAELRSLRSEVTRMHKCRDR